MRLSHRTACAAILPAFVLMPVFTASSTSAQEATPTAVLSCETVSASSMTSMQGMMMGTPMSGQSVEFDQLYIDMMRQHHASIIALAQAAQERLTDERLQTIADNIITAQSAENEELLGHRKQWYGTAGSMPMDETMMGMMTDLMPGLGDMASMQMQMNPQALVAAFCAGEDPDLTFIDLVIPHHEMAIHASEAALNQTSHEELRAIADRVIQDQQVEIDELETIRAELSGESTPVAS